MSTTYNFWVFLHIAGVLGFLAGNGVSWVAALRLRRERNPERLRALLDLAMAGRRLADPFGGLLLLGGIVAGFQGSYWSQGWIGTALLLVIVITGFGSVLIPRHVRAVRAALDGGQASAGLDTLLASNRPVVVTAVQAAGIAIILYLMVFKPF